MSHERHKVSELISRYSLEPTLRDVFVEGHSDVRFFRRVSQQAGVRDATFYPIGTVEIGPEELAKAGYNDSERDRVVYLSAVLAEGLTHNSRAVTCVADREFDLILGINHKSPFLILIDWLSMECYAFTPQAVGEFLHILSPESSVVATTILADVASLLQDLFALRATNVVMGANLEWIETFEKSCDVGTSPVTFDVEDFIVRYLGKSSALARKDEFIAKFREIRGKLPGEPRLSIRGHDIAVVLSWYFQKKLKKNDPKLRPEVLEQMLILAVDARALTECPSIQQLLERLRP